MSVQRLTLLCFTFLAITVTPSITNGISHDARQRYPYHVSVRHYNEHICSGSIINQRYILTSILCAGRYSPKDIYVVAGTNFLVNDGIIYEIEKIIGTHDEEDNNFIALLQTTRFIEFNDKVSPIFIADRERELVGETVVYTAWKKPTNEKPETQILQEFFYEIYDLKKCSNKYEEPFGKEFLCTIDPRHDQVCDLDFGGSVVTGGIQIGMRFSSDSRCTGSKPLIHNRIYYHSRWINENSDLRKFGYLYPVLSNSPVFEDNIREAFDGQYPYHVNIEINNKHHCSGSIINNRHILTSYTCIMSATAEDITIVTGTNSLKNGGTVYSIEKIITTDSIFNDIAILRTQCKINFFKKTQKIDISHFNYEDKSNYKVVITAWERFGQNRQSDKLQQFHHRIYDQKMCEKQYNFLDHKFLCTIDPSHRSLCNMDHGGPIVADHVQIGILSLVDQCGDQNGPYRQTPIYIHADWIERNTRLPTDEVDWTPCEIIPEVNSNIDYVHKRNLSINIEQIDNVNPQKPISRKPLKSMDPYRFITYPYHVIIRNILGKHLCSGSIINKRYILTSNTCVISEVPRNLYINAGTNSLLDPGDIYRIMKTIPSYNFDYDIALLRTDEDIQFNDNVKPIDIVTFNSTLYNAQRLTLSGYEHLGNMELQEIVYELYDREKCLENLNGPRDAYMCMHQLSEGNTNIIDRGSPIISGGIQVGLIPSVFRCDINEPHLFIPLSKHSNWIKKQSRI